MNKKVKFELTYPEMGDILKHDSDLVLDMWCAIFVLHMLKKLGIRSAESPRWIFERDISGGDKIEKFVIRVSTAMKCNGHLRINSRGHTR